MFLSFGTTPHRQDTVNTLLKRITGSTSGGGGNGQIMRGSGPPVAAPADPTKGAVYYDDDSASPSFETEWKWSVPDQAWIGA